MVQIFFIAILIFSWCNAMSDNIGTKVIEEMKTSLKDPCLDLLASSNLVDWDTFEKRIATLKGAIANFEIALLKHKTPTTVVESKPAKQSTFQKSAQSISELTNLIQEPQDSENTPPATDVPPVTDTTQPENTSPIENLPQEIIEQQNATSPAPTTTPIPN